MKVTNNNNNNVSNNKKSSSKVPKTITCLKKGKEQNGIDVFYLTKKNGLELCKIGSEELEAMYTDKGWLSQ